MDKKVGALIVLTKHARMALMQQPTNNYAFIDGANLHKAMGDVGWDLDYRKLRIWLTEKYGVGRAYIFIGLIAKYKDLYTHLQEAGFTLVFKEVVYDGAGKPKGNCDADLVLQAVRDAYGGVFEKAVIVSSDGDYAGLVKFLQERKQLSCILSPSIERKCSILLKRTNARIAYLSNQRGILELK
ncbi:MAG: NYN domain-containing protein [Patescibacteria group bacterium]